MGRVYERKSGVKGILKCRLIKGVVAKPRVEFESPVDASVLAEVERVGVELSSVIAKRFGRSLAIRELDSGSCGACESEISSTANPIYDVQRFGINFVASPRHADALLVTGPVSKNMLVALKKTFAAIPEPKFVIALGDCAVTGGIFNNSYYTEGAVDRILPVALHIPGCPPTPLDIIKSLLVLLRQK